MEIVDFSGGDFLGRRPFCTIGIVLINLSVFRESILISRSVNILEFVCASTQKLKHLLFLLTKSVYKKKIQSTDLITLLRFVVYRPTFALLCSSFHLYRVSSYVSTIPAIFYQMYDKHRFETRNLYIEFFANHEKSINFTFNISYWLNWTYIEIFIENRIILKFITFIRFNKWIYSLYLINYYKKKFLNIVLFSHSLHGVSRSNNKRAAPLFRSDTISFFHGKWKKLKKISKRKLNPTNFDVGIFISCAIIPLSWSLGWELY